MMIKIVSLNRFKISLSIMVREAQKTTSSILYSVKLCDDQRRIKPVQNVQHRLQLNGFGICTLNLVRNILVKISSALCMKPE